jgi:NADP-dependent 3-hydroxy acid dehydrogenase YdfG/acyl carrier protein
VTIYSTAESALPDTSWTRHAHGVLSAARAADDPSGDDPSGDDPSGDDSSGDDLSEWPPAGGIETDLAEFYPGLLGSGYGYGPVFQGLRRAWRRGEEMFAEVALPDGVAATGFGAHPALLDAALHALFLRDQDTAGGQLRLPFMWTGVTLVASGASALRVRLAPTGPDAVSIAVADDTGVRVASVDALTLRPVAAEQLRQADAGAADALYAVAWTAVEQARIDHQVTAVEVGSVADLAGLATPVPEVVTCAAVNDRLTGDLAVDAMEATGRVLSLLQAWLGDERFQDSRLVLTTRGVRSDPVPAAVAGLVRSAQSEHPDRFVLVDLDEPDGPTVPVEQIAAAVLATAEPQLAISGGQVRVPRLVRAAPAALTKPAGSAMDLGSRVLVTGGTGTLGALVARHLVTDNGVRDLVLASRSGPTAEGVQRLRSELTDLGATVTVVTCDVAERDQVADLLATHPVTAVVHAAGALADATVETLTPEHLEAVFRPKACAAAHLDQLTTGRELTAFVVFSSAAGVLGSPGQGNYAAANAYLDALGERRRAEGLPATSIAWGLWSRASGLTGGLGGTGQARLSRAAVVGLSDAEGLGLFDASLGLPAVVAARFDPVALHAAAGSGLLPPLLRGLVRHPARRAAQASAGTARSLRARLAALPEPERNRCVLGLVREHVAAVLGHDTVDAIEPNRPLKELGIDSLTAVELRNRLNGVSGLRLPATLIFDHPTAGAIADRLRSELAPRDVALASMTAELNRLERVFAQTDGQDRALAVDLLRQLLWRWGDATGAEDQSQPGAGLRTATAEDMFALIDNEFGASPVE